MQHIYEILCDETSFRCGSRRVITSLHNIPMAKGGNGCSFPPVENVEVNATFFN